MLITKRSNATGKVHTLELPVTVRQIDDWIEGGASIQNALPHLNVGQREFLLSGITPEEWNEIFKDED